MGYNVNAYNTDFIDLVDIIIDANELEAAKLIKDDDGEDIYAIFFFKNGHSHTVETHQYKRLRKYCRS